MSHSARRWTRLLAITGTVFLTLAVTVLALLQVPVVATWVMGRVITFVPLNPGYELEVGYVSGDWLHRLVLDDVRLLQDDRELARINRLKAAYDLRQLRGPETRLRELAVEGATALARRQGDVWDLANALKRSADTTATKGGGFRIERLELRDVQLAAELAPDSLLRVRGLTLRAHDLVVGEQLLLNVDQLNAAVAAPGTARWFAVATRGAVTADMFRFDPVRIQTEDTRIFGGVVLPRDFDDSRLVDRLDIRLQATPLALADLAALVPAVTPEGSLQLDAHATGGADGLVTAHLGARLDEATVRLDGSAPVGNGRTDYRLRGTVHKLDPARLLHTAPAGSLNGSVLARLQGPTLSRSDGRVELRLSPSRLGGTSVQRLNLGADVRSGSAAFALRGSIEQGTLTANGRIRPFDSIPEYRLSGSAEGLPGSAALARGLAGKAGEPVLDVDFRLAGAGLSASESRLNGRVELTALRQDGDRVPIGHATLALAAGRLDARSELLVGGGKISAHAVARLGDTLTYEVRGGRIDRVDLGPLLADTSLAAVSGRFALAGRGAAPAQATVSGSIALKELRYGQRRVEQVTGQVRLDAGRAHVELRGLLQGGRVALDASARPFDTPATFAVQRASLERVDLGTFLERPNLAGPVNLRASGSGRWSKQIHFVRGRVVIEPSRLGGIGIAGGLLDARLSGERLTYNGSIKTNAGAFALAGDGRPLDEVRSFAIRRGRVDSLDLGTLLGRSDLQTGINARFNGTLAQDSLHSETRLALELLPSRINGAELSGGQVTLERRGESLQGDLRVQGRDGELKAELSGQTGEAMQLRTNGSLRLERLARWTGRAERDGRLESSFDLKADGDSAGLVSLGGTINAIGGIGDVRFNAVHLALRPDSGAIHFDTLFLRSNVAALDGSGRVALRGDGGSDTLRVTGISRDVAPLAALAGADSVSLDSARLALRVTGPAWHWRVDGNAEVHGILAAGNLANRLTVRAGATLDSTRLAAVDGELHVENAAYGKTRIPEANLVARYDSLVSLEAKVAIGDSVRLAAGMRGTAAGDTMRAVLHRLDLTEGGRNWGLEQPADLMLRPQLIVDGLGLRAGSHRITLNGTLDRRGSSDIALRLTNVDLDVLREIELSPIGGRLDGWVRLAGPSTAPSLQGSLGLAIREREGSEIGRIRTDLEWTQEGLRLDATAAPRTGGRLTVNGTMPWRLTLAPADTAAVVATLPASARNVALSVRADSFDLGLFEPLLPPETARELRGRLVADARVTGTPEAPRADGTLRVTGFGVTVPTLDLTYRGGELLGRMAGDELRVERFQLRTEKEELLTAQGRVRLRPLTDPSLDLTAELSKFHISNSQSLDAIASGRLRLRGTAQAPSLTGDLTMGRTDIVVGAGQASATVEKVELTPQDFRQLAHDFGPAVLEQADDSPGLVDRFRLDLNLRLPRRVWFRKRTSPKAEIELSGRIRLRQEPGDPMQFFGRVEPVPGRGGLDVYGREFELIGGAITLAGPVDSASLDVTAQYRVPTQGGPEDEGVLIDVAARGHPDSLTLEFSGDPEMSQDDMLSYIVTGRPSSDNPLAEQQGGGESAGEMGAAVALSGLTQSLATAAEKELGLDVFQIRQEGLHGLTLTAGRYVGSRVFLSMHLPIELSSQAEQTPGTNLGPSFELEYAIQRWLRADVLGGNVPPRFTLRSRYAY